jgi:spore maturation protein CgeB
MAGRLIIVGTQRMEALESSYARAFTRLGWEVHTWDPMEALHRSVRGHRVGQLLAMFVHIEPWLRKANLELLQLASRVTPDLVLVIGTAGVRSGTLAQLRVWLPRARIYCLYPDGPHNLEPDRVNCLPLFDRVLTSSPAWVDAFSKLGASQVHYLPFAADVDLHSPVEPAVAELESAHELAFIGNWRREREEFLEQFVDLDLRIWGGDYWRSRTRKGSPLERCWAGQSAVGSEFARACAQSKILLNILDPISWPGPNMRTFELPACGAFALVERTAPVLDLFREGETIECFGSVAEARQKIERYTQDEVARQRIAQAAYEFVVGGGHTYRDRVRQILELDGSGAA